MYGQRGFTVLEIIVAVGIILLITLAGALNYSSFGLFIKTSASTEDVLTLIRDARYMSTSVNQLGVSGKFPNYGVAFKTASPTVATIYADCVADNSGDGNLNGADDFTDTDTSCSPASNLVKTYRFPTPIIVQAIRTTAPQTTGYVEFLRPEPTTWLTADGAVLSSGSIEVDIGDRYGKFKKTIVIWTNGLVTTK